MAKPASHKQAATVLARKLGLFDSTMMMVGIVIGSGIFLTTGIMAKSIPSAGLTFTALGIPVFFVWKKKTNLDVRDLRKYKGEQ